MSRDPKKMRVFHDADALVFEVYDITKHMPSEERFGLQSQIRRATVSVPTNLVEGCSRRENEFKHYLRIASGSASEARYLIGLAHRLQFLGSSTRSGDLHDDKTVQALDAVFGSVLRQLEALIRYLNEGGGEGTIFEESTREQDPWP